MYAPPFVSFIYFKLAIRCCPPVFDNFSVKLLFIQQKSYDFINEFLILSSIAVIMIHNAVERCNMLADCDEMSKALPNAELLFVIPEGIHMAASYKKLWKLLIDKDIKKKDLSAKAGVSPATITKMGKNGHVTTEVLLKICTALECGIDDIMEIIPEMH